MSFYPDGVNRANLTVASSSDCAITTPADPGGNAAVNPALQGTMQQVMMENLGQYVQVDFLIGINTIVRRSGILYSVGRGYIVLYDETEQDFILCDAYSAKFINFYGSKPPAGSSLNQGLGLLRPDTSGLLRTGEGMGSSMAGSLAEGVMPSMTGSPGIYPGGAQAALEQLQAEIQAGRLPQRGPVAFPGARTLGDS